MRNWVEVVQSHLFRTPVPTEYTFAMLRAADGTFSDAFENVTQSLLNPTTINLSI